MQSAHSLFERVRSSLLARVVLALMAVGLVPLTMVSYQLLRLNLTALTDQVLRTHSLAAHTAAERVATFVDMRLGLARGLASQLAQIQPQSAQAEALLEQNNRAWADIGVLAIVILNANGDLVTGALLRGLRETVEQVNELPASSPVLAIKSPDGLLLRLDAPLTSQIGTLRLLCDAADLTDVLYAEEIGDQADWLLADRSGELILGSLPSLDQAPAGMLENAFSGRVGGSGRYPSSDGQEILGAFAPVRGTNWTVLSQQPIRVAQATAVTMRRRSLLVFAVAAALIALLSAIAFRTVIRPIREVVAAQRDLAGLSGTEGGGEIEELTASFEALERRLQDRAALDQVFLGRYQVQELVGAGAMGTVFRGWDPRLERSVCLKTVRLDESLSHKKRQVLVTRLLDEAKTIAKFTHPNIVAVFDVESSGRAAFIAMEYVAGMSLDFLLWQVGRLEPDQVIPLSLGIARALQAAHLHGVVHRDVKPGNVLLGRDNSIKVADFGLANPISSSDVAEGAIFGTPGFLPPEYMERGSFDERGDLFALGAVIYQCLTGRPAFQGKSDAEIMGRTIVAERVAPSESVPDLPPELDTLVLRLLDRDPQHRPQNAGAVVGELERMSTVRSLRWIVPVDVGHTPSDSADISPTPTQHNPPG